MICSCDISQTTLKPNRLGWSERLDAIWCNKELTWPCRSRYEPDWQEDAVACAMDCNGKLRWRRHDQAWQGYLRQPCHLFNNTRVQFTSCETRVALWRYSSEVKMTDWKNGVEWHSFGQTICKQLKSSSPFLSRIMHFATTRTHDVKAPSSAQPNNSGQKNRKAAEFIFIFLYCIYLCTIRNCSAYINASVCRAHPAVACLGFFLLLLLSTNTHCWRSNYKISSRMLSKSRRKKWRQVSDPNLQPSNLFILSIIQKRTCENWVATMAECNWRGLRPLAQHMNHSNRPIIYYFVTSTYYYN